MELDVALRYAKLGLKVVPVAYKKKGPIIKDWVNNASSDPSMLKDWFAEGKRNIGIATGKSSNIVVIDIDNHNGEDGMKSIAALEDEMGSYLPETVTSRTQSGGIHLWFQYPAGVERITGKIGIVENVDIRADGNQVLVYPSVGESGTYEWIRSPFDTKIAKLPKAWKQFICGEFRRDDIAKIRIPKRAFVLPDVVPSGLRHATLLSYACSLSHKKLSPDELAGAVREANSTRCNPPISDDDEVNNIIEYAVDQMGKHNIDVPDGIPEWITISEKGQYIVVDSQFVSSYKDTHSLVCVNGKFYNEEGTVSDDAIKQDVQKQIAPYVYTSLATKVNSLFDSLRTMCYIAPPVPDSSTVHFQNCSLRIDRGGIREVPQEFTLNKLCVEYEPDSDCPGWMEYLSDLLYEEDIPTLQEYIGYCLLPVTYAQKALFIISSGGQGKSVIGNVLYHIFRQSMVQAELHKLQDNRFMLAELENKLVFYDDDLQTSALTDTGTFKKIVTASIPLLVERKGIAHYQILPYARIIAAGNKGIEACYDHSDGFYRRLIVLKCRPTDPDRVVNRLFGQDIIENELSGIVNWALEGLQRLIANGWEFSLSQRAQDNLTAAEEEGNNILSFLRDETAVIYDDSADATSSELYDAYEKWCDDNAMKALNVRTFSNYIRENTDKYGIEYTNNIMRGSSRRRGFRGIGILESAKQPKVGRFKVVKGGSR